MGCGASKGNSSGADTAQNTDITFKPTQCQSMDDFFNSATGVIQAFKDITAPLGEQKDNFLDVTGFWEVCGTSKYPAMTSTSAVRSWIYHTIQNYILIYLLNYSIGRFASEIRQENIEY